MTRGEREKLCEIMGFLWAKSEDALCAGYAESLGDMLAADERENLMGRENEIHHVTLNYIAEGKVDET